MSADAIVATALMLEGMSFGQDPKLYCDTLYPYDGCAHAHEMGSMQSSCGLTCEAILRMADVDGTIHWRNDKRDWLRTPYANRLGTAISLPLAIAKANNLWVSAMTHDLAADLPEPGDMVLIGGSQPGRWGGVEHILTVTGRDGKWLESIDGGRIDTNNRGRCTAIERVLRCLIEVPEHKELWIAKPNIRIDRDGRPVEGRRVQGWVRAGELPCVVAT